MLHKSANFAHGSLNLQQKRKIVFTSYSKKRFYLRSQISAFVLANQSVPISPFMNFDYNLAGIVDKKFIRIANNTLIKKSDELWVFGEISDGVMIEIYLAKKFGKLVRFFEIIEQQDNKFEEIAADKVHLEDVSPWIWEWAMTGKSLERWHPRLRFKKVYPVVFSAYSKKNFYLQMHISKFCIEKRTVPLNPFMLSWYFLGDSVPREQIYNANNNLLRISDNLWTFGDISNGVLAEVKMFKERGKQPEYYKEVKKIPIAFHKIGPQNVTFEQGEELEKYRNIL